MMVILPDWWVGGPARQASDSGRGRAAGIADLGQQPRGAHGARAGQRGEDFVIGVGGQLLVIWVCSGKAPGGPGIRQTVGSRPGRRVPSRLGCDMRPHELSEHIREAQMRM